MWRTAEELHNSQMFRSRKTITLQSQYLQQKMVDFGYCTSERQKNKNKPLKVGFHYCNGVGVIIRIIVDCSLPSLCAVSY